MSRHYRTSGFLWQTLGRAALRLLMLVHHMRGESGVRSVRSLLRPPLRQPLYFSSGLYPNNKVVTGPCDWLAG